MAQRTGRSVRRSDRIAWVPDARKKVEGPGGAWDIPGVAARTGIQGYEGDDGEELLEIRPHSEVMDPASLATLRGVALTLQHPGDGVDDDAGAGEVNTENFRGLTHGSVLDVQPDVPSKGLVGVVVRVNSDDLLQAADSGTRELSCGYVTVLRDPADPEMAELVATLGPSPGITHDGERYHLIQTEIQYNHLAVVDRARAGSVASLKLDRAHHTMANTKITFKRDGREISVEVPTWMIDAAKPSAQKADAEGVLAVSIEGKPDMVLPEEMVGQMLSAVGMGGGASTPEPEPVVPPDAADPLLDAEEEEEKADEVPDAFKADAALAAKIEKMVADGIAKAVPAQAARIADAATASARDRTELESRAHKVLGDGFAYGSADATGICLAVVREAKSPHASKCDSLASAARKGDAAAVGQLRAYMDVAVEGYRKADSSTEMLEIVFDSDEGPTTVHPREATRLKLLDSARSGRSRSAASN